MNDRHTVDTITDDALDQLYAQLDELHQEINAAGTALADMARKRNEQMDRAEQAEAKAERYNRAAVSAAALSHAANEKLRRNNAWLSSRVRELEQRVDRVRAVVEALCDEPHPAHDHICPDNVRKAIRDAIEEQPAPAPAATDATGHVYLSTGCLHGHHDYCQNHTGHSGTKTPAQCKFCAAPCTCGCHTDTPQPADQPKEQ